jgi:glucokinase
LTFFEDNNLVAVISIDLGGTKIGMALMAERDIVNDLIISTQPEEGPNVVIARMTEAVRGLVQQGREQGLSVRGIGLAAPGVMDLYQRSIVYSPNLNWRQVPVVALLSRELLLPVWMGNDADLYALGEFVDGCGSNRHDLICFTLGTGVGSGIIRAGQIQSGMSGWSSEMGHITIDPAGSLCGCGSYGCLEAYASSTGLRSLLRAALAQGRASSLSPDDGVWALEEAAAKRDPLALDIFAQAGRALGIGIINAVLSSGIERVVLGGGVSSCWYLMEESAWMQIKASLKIISWHKIQIMTSMLGQEATLRGASALAQKNLPPTKKR